MPFFYFFYFGLDGFVRTVVVTLFFPPQLPTRTFLRAFASCLSSSFPLSPFTSSWLGFGPGKEFNGHKLFRPEAYASSEILQTCSPCPLSLLIQPSLSWMYLFNIQQLIQFIISNNAWTFEAVGKHSSRLLLREMCRWQKDKRCEISSCTSCIHPTGPCWK